jgi:hypothetical protein
VHHRRRQLRGERNALASPPRTLDCALDEQIEAHVLRFLLVALAAGELHQFGDQRAHLCELLGHVAHELRPLGRLEGVAFAREHLHVRAQARQRRAQLVRSVLHELAL